jgi:RNA 2',3'-cyclic 3'-phosphodiesterase
VSSPGSVGGNERLRLFLALRLPDDVVASIADWQAGLFQDRELRGRLVPPGNLHVTLAFLGSRPAGELPTILRILEDAARDAEAPSFEVVRWRERRAAGMLELRDSTGTTAARLAGRVQGELADLGLYRLENRDWLPHVTVLRYRDPPRLSPELPELGPVVPSEAAAYLSRLHPSGAVYEVLESFPLKSLNSREVEG